MEISHQSQVDEKMDAADAHSIVSVHENGVEKGVYQGFRRQIPSVRSWLDTIDQLDVIDSREGKIW